MNAQRLTFARLAFAGGVLLALAPAAQAGDLQERPPTPASPLWDWTGGYLGVFLAGGAGSANFHSPFGPSVYGDKVTTDLLGGGGQIGFNRQITGSRFVVGVEADGGDAEMSASKTCFAPSGFMVPASCRVHGGDMATGTMRIGYGFGAAGRTLGYVKGGAAALFEQRDASDLQAAAVASSTGQSFTYARNDWTKSTTPLLGFTVGVGMEQALTRAWSVKLEYDYADYGREGIATPATNLQIAPPRPVFVPIARSSSYVDQDSHIFKIGLNYRFGADSSSLTSLVERFTAIRPLLSNQIAGLPLGWSAEVGARYWYSQGQLKKDLTDASGNNSTPGATVASLTYGTSGSSGELFGRLESPYKVFVKGYIGLGGTSGDFNDEDFTLSPPAYQANGPFELPYSNTRSDVNGHIDYATIDAGYDAIRFEAASLGFFVGFNRYKDDENARGFTQISNSFFDVYNRPNSVITVQQTSTYDALRLGMNSEIRYGRFRIQGDAAYLPYVRFIGDDNHPLRTALHDTYSPEHGQGDGIQLELILSYYITPHLALGLGGRYWYASLPNVSSNQFGSGQIANYVDTQRRYGSLAQVSYKF